MLLGLRSDTLCYMDMLTFAAFDRHCSIHSFTFVFLGFLHCGICGFRQGRKKSTIQTLGILYEVSLNKTKI